MPQVPDLPRIVPAIVELSPVFMRIVDQAVPVRPDGVDPALRIGEIPFAKGYLSTIFLAGGNGHYAPPFHTIRNRNPGQFAERRIQVYGLDDLSADFVFFAARCSQDEWYPVDRFVDAHVLSIRVWLL